MAEQKSSSALTAPLRNAASAVRHVPGAGMVTKAAEETLDRIGAVSPRGRRMAVYAGAGVLGAVGVVEWPVALTGAAVAWLTQPRPQHDGETAHPEAGAGMTDTAGHGAYVAMGDAATETTAPQAPAAGAPGPMREDEMPGGAWTRPGDPAAPTAPAVDPLVPPVNRMAPPLEPEASPGPEDPPSTDPAPAPPPTS
ncbi:hypothetical protein OHB00_08860 [Streptomyces sp. NBC_00631]|uniref:hypothetical protein n=1 Tax=Streptomyces sp. NBC_00631 TaxID=2975793 RepID=UPI0030E5D287